MAQDHPYDNPDLMPREWLLAVMHDKTISLRTRIEVAAELLQRWPEEYGFRAREPWPGEPRITIIINGLGNDWADNGPEAQVRVSVTKDHEPGMVGHA
jgi:hypothetical protein